MPYGELLWVREVAAKREGVKCWEIHWRVPYVWDLVPTKLFNSPIFKFIGKDGKEISADLRIGMGAAADGVEWLWIVGPTYYDGTPTTKSSVSLLDKGRVERYHVTEKDFSGSCCRLCLLQWGFLLVHKASLAPNGSITLIYRLQVVVKEPGLSLHTRVTNPLSKLFESGERSDAVITVHDKTFPVHRLVLSLYSPALAAMFDSDMKEGNTGKVDISDTTPDIVEAVLRYMYTGSLYGVEEHTAEILHLADKYLIDDLKEVCSISLAENLSVENTVDCLKLSRQYSLNYLQERIAEFLSQHKDILQTDPWMNFMSEDPVFANKIFMNVLSI